VVGGGNTLGLNVVYAIVFLAIWALTLKLVQKSIQASKEDNPNFDSSFYQIIAIFTGALSVFLEISAVRGVALLG